MTETHPHSSRAFLREAILPAIEQKTLSEETRTAKEEKDKGLRLDLVLIAFAAVAAVALMLTGAGAEILKQAAGVPDSAQGFGRIKQISNALQTPMLFAAGALLPLCLIGGAIALAAGSRTGMTWIGRAIGAMILLACAGGLAT